MDFFDTYSSPIGLITICSDGDSVTRVSFSEKELKSVETCNVLENTLNQLHEYFKGERQEFDIPVNPKGTDFQKSVWNELMHIPFGQTASYKDIAIKTGNTNNVRAVGAANGKNPIAIIIPCHRIVGTEGKLTGYAGGIWRKKWLLNHEFQFKPHKNTLF